MRKTHGTEMTTDDLWSARQLSLYFLIGQRESEALRCFHEDLTQASLIFSMIELV